MIYRAELAALAAAHPNVRLVRIFTDAPGTGDLDGFLSAEQLDAIDPAWRTTPTYVCGPAPLMDGARALYAEAGAADLLRTEAFTLAQVLAEAGTVGGTLRFDGADLDVVDDGRPILEQAEAAGLDPRARLPHGHLPHLHPLAHLRHRPRRRHRRRSPPPPPRPAWPSASA